ncbi:hypothetical protein KR084_007218 [Drosophila pseudotakahashii]|nr:hypothetical protein KR084_007218 [Drosophila pseudotakahashii]
MAKTTKSKFVDVRSGIPDKGKKSPKKFEFLRAKKYPKVVKDVSAKLEVISAPSSLIPTKSLTTLSTDSEDLAQSVLTSGWNTPISGHSPRRKHSGTKSAGKKKVRMSHMSVNSSLIPRKSINATNKKERYFEGKIYKIKKPQSSESVQVIKLNKDLTITSPTESDGNPDEYATSEEECLDDIVLSEGEMSDSQEAITSIRESQISVSSDSDLRMRYNLLHSLRRIPHWDQLSATTSLDPYQWNEKEKKAEEEDEDLGKIRDPLARNSSITSVHSMGQTEEEEALTPDDPDVISLPLISSSELESDDDSEWKLERTRIESSVIPVFTELSSGSWSSRSSTHERSRLPFPVDHVVQCYLDELIEKVVDIIENPLNLLAKSLEKGKLMDRIIEEVDDLTWERYKNECLTKRLVEHHLRRFKYSLITPSKISSIDESYRRRYLSALDELDHWLQRKREAEDIHMTERDRLIGEIEQMQAQDNERVEEMEQIIRRTLFCHAQTSDRLKLVTENALRQMRKKREALSEIRLVLIIKQHNNAYIIQKLNETETISGEVKMDTYLSTETDVQQLVNTLNHRNAELLRMYGLIKSKIHTISHLRCRRKLLSRKFRGAKGELRKNQKQEKALRDKLYAGNLEHNKLIAKINEVRHKGGIMSYPKLLLDFDQTTNYVLMKRDHVHELREQHDSLVGRIDKLECKIQESQLRLSISASE